MNLMDLSSINRQSIERESVCGFRIKTLPLNEFNSDLVIFITNFT